MPGPQLLGSLLTQRPTEESTLLSRQMNSVPAQELHVTSLDSTSFLSLVSQGSLFPLLEKGTKSQRGCVTCTRGLSGQDSVDSLSVVDSLLRAIVLGGSRGHSCMLHAHVTSCDFM